MLGILADAADKTTDIGEFFKGACRQVNAVDLAGFAAGVGVAVAAPGYALGVVEAVAKIADNGGDLGVGA